LISLVKISRQDFWKHSRDHCELRFVGRAFTFPIVEMVRVLHFFHRCGGLSWRGSSSETSQSNLVAVLAQRREMNKWL
jgi:hypothetical protein